MAHGVALDTITDEDLVTLLNDANTEHYRRQRMKQIPEHLAAMTVEFERDGGDRASLIKSVTEAKDTEE